MACLEEYPPDLMESVTANEENIRNKILWYHQLIKLIEDCSLQLETLQCIPADDLTVKASKNLTLKSNGCYEESLVLELLKWFPNSFFSCVDAVKCKNCFEPAEYRGLVQPTTEESSWFVRRVENYFCNTCKVFTRFPRLNHPKKLLELKTGGREEGTILFTLICRALDLDTRIVLDVPEYSWIEIFSPTQDRWIHCDPFKKKWDEPLLYEVGWKRTLYLIIAFSKDEFQDVTWRYSCKYDKVLKRREMMKCRESFILSWITYCTKRCRSGATKERLQYLMKRQVKELVDFLTPPKFSPLDFHKLWKVGGE